MATFPLEPAFAKMILFSKACVPIPPLYLSCLSYALLAHHSIAYPQEFHCTEDVLNIVSILSADTGKIFHVPKEKKDQAAAARKRFLSYDGSTSCSIVSNHCWADQAIMTRRSLYAAERGPWIPRGRLRASLLP
jgi:hypothetical protein